MNKMSMILVSTIGIILLAGVLSQDLLDYREVYQSHKACNYGRLQSPINLAEYFSNFNSSISILYNEYVPLQNARLTFNGKIFEVTASNSDNLGYLGFQRGGVIKQYTLKKIEINYPGEHQIEGQTSDLEIKLIHEKILPYETTVNQYRRIPDSNTHLIISLLYKTSSKSTDNGFLNTILSTWKSGTNTLNYLNSVNLDLNSYDLVTDRPFFYYEGSFTTDPCNELVNYVVINEMFTVTNNQLFEFKNQLSQLYKNDGETNKATAPYYGRKVYRNYKNYTESQSGKFIETSNLLVLFSIMIIAFIF